MASQSAGPFVNVLLIYSRKQTNFSSTFRPIPNSSPEKISNRRAYPAHSPRKKSRSSCAAILGIHSVDFALSNGLPFFIQLAKLLAMRISFGPVACQLKACLQTFASSEEPPDSSRLPLWPRPAALAEPLSAPTAFRAASLRERSIRAARSLIDPI